MSRRLGIMAAAIFLLFAAVVAQAANVQFFRAGALNASPLNPRNTMGASLFQRGSIIAADGTVLAKSVPATGGYSPWQRVYPLGSLVSGMVGFSSPTYGNWALEYQYNQYLTPHTLPAKSWAQVLAPQTGADSVTLTIYPALQRVMRNALAGRDGAAVVLDPRTGAILGMYSNPTYVEAPLESQNYLVAEAYWKKITTPNAHHFQPLGVVATQQSFPPGSTFKVITTTAAIQGRPDLLTKHYPVKVTISLPQSNQTLSNFAYSACGGDVAQMLPPSCDTGYALLGLDLGGDLLASTANEFGLNQVPPIDLPGAAASAFPSAASFLTNQPGVAYSAIGQQNVRETALQNALVAAAIADGGTMMTPHLMDYVTAPDGSLVTRYTPHAWLKPMTPSQTAILTPLMHEVVTQGTAYGVFPAYLDAAAKTGTAQVGNAAKNTDDWMIAFMPASHPTIAVAVVLPFQVVSGTGATVAGPVISCISEAAYAIQHGQKPTGTPTTCKS